VTLVRILIWNLADSKTTLDELRDQLPLAADGEIWFANDAAERFGVVSINDDLPELEHVRALIGKEPDVAEEFDAMGV
jgi:hypothetical protein